jgi:hypothetical protein
MLKLKLHIGLPKTATTFFQEKCFNSNGYLGKKLLQPEVNEQIRAQFQELATTKILYQKKDLLEQQTIQLVQNLVSFSKNNNCKTISMSSEGLMSWYDETISAKWPMHGYFKNIIRDPQKDPLCLYLKNFFVPIWQRHGDLELVVVARNQSDFLASIYAQISYSIVFRSQRNFELQFMRLIENNDPFLDYHTRFTELSKCVGINNFHVFFYETLFEKENFDRFTSVMNAIGNNDDTNSFMNKRRVDGSEKSWALRPRIGLLETLTTAFGWTDKTIKLTPKMMTNMKAHCSIANEQLASKTGVNLSEYGY